MQPELKVELGFTQRRLPWLIAAVGLLCYVITLNHSPTFAGLSALVKSAGWDWRSNIVAPIQVLLTWPIRWLPASLQLACLNLLAAVCAALALGLLARSVALLPHDRTREQRALERSDYSLLSIRAAWLPPALAALACGLQLTFWENAVVATGEALDLLIFAWLVHALLQYRLDQKESRLTRFAVVYALAVTNNFAMVAFLPAFLVAMFWIKGRSFFNWRFLLRMLGGGLAGLSLYLLLPAVDSLTGASGFSFWDLLHSYWGAQKNGLLILPRYVIILSSFTSLLPVLFMGIRWPAQFGEVSAAGNALTNLMSHLIHLVFLVACIYVAFDPPFSPRNLSGELYTLLPLYYLGALAIGYCSGYLLLVFGAKPGPQAWQRPSALRQILNYSVVALVWVALGAVPAGLLVKNLPSIWANDGQGVRRMSQATARSLPEQGAFVLSDDPFRLYALQYELLKSNPAHQYVLVDTTSLAASGYHRFMQKRHPQLWPKFARPMEPMAMLDGGSLVQLIDQLYHLRPVYYLHPSFGYYFESYYTKPHQLVYQLEPYPTNRVSAPPLTAAEIQEQDAFWRSLQAQELDPLIRNAVPFSKPAKSRAKSRTMLSYLGDSYSRALNHFGVQVQRAGDSVKAAEYFDLAVRLNPANPAAFLNREFNQSWRAGKRASDKPSEATADRLAAYGGRWDFILGQNGPLDEPGACYLLAQAFERGNNFRQAAQCLERTILFDPDNRSARLVLILMYVKAQFPDLALEQIADFRSRYRTSSLKADEEMELLRAEAWAFVVKNDLESAEKLLTAAREKYPSQSTPWETLFDIYLQLDKISNAVNILDLQLKSQPRSVRALVNYGGLKIKMTQFADALPYLNQALEISPKDEAARLNRAVANFSINQFDAAQQDYEDLLNSGTSYNRLQVLFGLAETYFHKKNKKESLRYYQDFLKVAPPGMPEILLVRQRIKSLESGAVF